MTQEPPPPESPPPYVDVQALLDLPIPAPIPAPRVPSDPRDELWDPHHLAADGDDEDDEEQADAVNPLATSSAEETLARISAPPVPSGRKASKFYSEANMLKRLELMKHPEILASLEKLWVSVRDLRPRNLVASGRCSKALLEGPSACAVPLTHRPAHLAIRSPRDLLSRCSQANTDTRDAVIDKDEYLVMHRKIVSRPAAGPRSKAAAFSSRSSLSRSSLLLLLLTLSGWTLVNGPL